MTGFLRVVAGLLSIVLLLACEPQDDRPGLWLSGSEVATLPEDWAFTDDYREIEVEVATPYLIRHSVTIWCAQVDGRLYVAAASPESKNWPGWVEDDPDVRLKIGAQIYPVRLDRISEAAEIASVAQAYQHKYELQTIGGGAPVRYWRVAGRS